MATNRSTDTGLADALTRPGDSATTIWRPRRIGPRFRWLDHDTIKLVDGKLAGQEFGLTTDVQRTTAELVLTEGKERCAPVPPALPLEGVLGYPRPKSILSRFTFG